MQKDESGESRAARRLNNRIDQLDYVRAMIRELRAMTAAERFDMITLHLEMAYLEASDMLRDLNSEQRASKIESEN